ncbi:hypothetical protein G9A89_020502 [Geosiphon pyriformis]|nr:hypothetical protein G9A89_020502 [Geosiphon pyriformis]
MEPADLFEEVTTLSVPSRNVSSSQGVPIEIPSREDYLSFKGVPIPIPSREDTFPDQLPDRTHAFQPQAPTQSSSISPLSPLSLSSPYTTGTPDKNEIDAYGNRMRKRKVLPWEDNPDEESLDPSEVTMADLCGDIKTGRKSKKYKKMLKKRYIEAKRRREEQKAAAYEQLISLEVAQDDENILNYDDNVNRENNENHENNDDYGNYEVYENSNNEDIYDVRNQEIIEFPNHQDNNERSVRDQEDQRNIIESEAVNVEHGSEDEDFYNDPAIAELRLMEIQETNAAPQIRFVDGKAVLDQESLLVDRTAAARNEEQETPMPIIIENEFNRKLTNYGSFMPRRLRTTRWTAEDNELFFKGLSQWGTDFGIIAQMFPYRNRKQIKAKYKRESKINKSKVDHALMHKIPVDLEEYSRLAGQEFPEVDKRELMLLDEPERAQSPQPSETTTLYIPDSPQHSEATTLVQDTVEDPESPGVSETSGTIQAIGSPNSSGESTTMEDPDSHPASDAEIEDTNQIDETEEIDNTEEIENNEVYELDATETVVTPGQTAE